jgi:hypothetical protein
MSEYGNKGHTNHMFNLDNFNFKYNLCNVIDLITILVYYLNYILNGNTGY